MGRRCVLGDKTISFLDLLSQRSACGSLYIFRVEVILAADSCLIIDNLGYRRVAECLSDTILLISRDGRLRAVVLMIDSPRKTLKELQMLEIQNK